jgi:electron transfer flavoprotein alpha/beta subunit
LLAENAEMLSVLEATGLNWTRDLDKSLLTMRAPLPIVIAGPLSPGHPRRPPTVTQSRGAGSTANPGLRPQT